MYTSAMNINYQKQQRYVQYEACATRRLSLLNIAHFCLRLHYFILFMFSYIVVYLLHTF